MTGTLPPLLDSVVGGGTPERRCLRVLMNPMLMCPGKGLVLPNLNIDDIARNTRLLLILSLPNNDMSKKSPFAIHKVLIGISGEPKSVKRLKSGDLLIETSSALQTKSLLLATSFLDSPLIISPHKSLNTSRGVISEPDLLSTPEAEILVGCDSGKPLAFRISSIKPTTQIEYRLPEPISASSAALDNSLNTSTSSLSSETCPAPTTSNKFAALQPSVTLSESATTTPNSELSNTSKVPQNVKQNSKNRRKRTKTQKPEIEIKIAKHKPRKSGPIEYTTYDENIIMHDVEAEELEPNPEDKFAMKECFINNPNEYMRALTPTRFRKSRS
ncbi:uncharacterized protein TNCV_2720001 [Trichonephila clavipes]|nr:uncharacterized protein TNCV_2720001 [Trichonephila clavipes]